MAGALLYFPGARNVLSAVRGAGLAHLLENSPGLESLEILQDGPDADGRDSVGTGCGLLVRLLAGGHAGRLTPLGLRGALRWFRAPADPVRQLPAGRYHLGWRDAPPVPSELIRPAVYESIEVRLDDGNLWQIPIARELPTQIVCDAETGELTRKTAAPFADYVERAEALMELAVYGERAEREVSWKEGYEHVVRGLCLNYLLTRELVNALGLLQQAETIFAAAGASWEFQRWAEAAEASKKNG